MPIINVPVGGQARSIHVQQIINWLRGIPTYSEAVSFTGTSSSSAYALSVANGGLGGLALAVKNSNQTITLLEAKEAGVIVRPNALAGTYFRVRNFADNADLLTVDQNGLSISSDTVVTLTATQTLTNKTLTSPNLTTPVLTSYQDILNLGAPPSAPSAGRIRLWETGDLLFFKNSANTTRQLATIDGTETLSAKTLSLPIVSGASLILQGAAPSSPIAGQVALYCLTAENVLKVKLSSGTVKELVDTDSIQTLSNKTLASAVFSGALLTSPDVTNYAEFDWSSNPGGGVLKSRLWAKNDNNMYFTLPSGTQAQILTNVNTPIVSTLSLARPLALSGG